MIADGTLAGYLERHSRPPAFSGSDGSAYSVEIYVEETPELGSRFAAALLFVRWSPGGDQPVGHLESEYLAFGNSRSSVKTQLGTLTLQDVKQHLERLIEGRRELPDW